MKWIGEVENSETVYFKNEKVQLDLTIAKIVQQTTDG